MSRLTTLKEVVWTKKGVVTTSLVALSFLIISYFINGSPESVFYLANYKSPYVLLQRGSLLILALLIGFTATMMTYRLQTAGLTKKEGTASTIAGVLGIIGSGCAGCVAGIIPGILATLGIGFNFLALPLLGTEFILFSILLITGTLHWMLAPISCPLKKPVKEKDPA